MRKRWKVGEMKGQAAAVAFHAYLSVMLNVSMSETAASLIPPEAAKAYFDNPESDPMDYQSMLFDVIRKLPEDHRKLKRIFIELLARQDKDFPEYMKMLQVVQDSNGGEINSSNLGSFSPVEITEMLFDAWHSLLTYSSDVFF